jgi:mRNA-degrading endonuclease RelE of RelBE toxin-antitoxin system
MYSYGFGELAQERLARITKRNPRLGESLVRKIEWLAENADTIPHQRVRGTAFFSLHSASYRIIYDVVKPEQRILVVDIGHHDEVYNRVNRLK